MQSYERVALKLRNPVQIASQGVIELQELWEALQSNRKSQETILGQKARRICQCSW